MRPELKMTKIEDVECFCSENKGNYLHTFDNRDYLLILTLKQLESEIDPKDFYRVSIKFIVMIKGIKAIQMHSNSRLKIILPTSKNDEVMAARKRVNDLKEWLG